MTTVSGGFAVRVMVTDVWDQVVVPVDAATTISELKQEALRRALKRRDISSSRYVVKFRGALVHEAATLGRLGAGPNAPFIILPAAREPVR